MLMKDKPPIRNNTTIYMKSKVIENHSKIVYL